MQLLPTVDSKVRLALATFVIAGTIIGGVSLALIWPRLFLPLDQRVGEAFAACLFADAEGCSKLVPAHLEGCEDGKAKHCHKAAELIFQGRIVQQDRPRALALFRRACDMGRGVSCYAVGRLLREGLGVPADHQGATRAYRAACNLEAWGACQHAALQLARDGATDGEWRDAEALLGVACKQGLHLACYNYSVVRTRIDGSADYATGVVERQCGARPPRCDVARLALREPNASFETDQRVFSDLCAHCGPAPRPGSATHIRTVQ